MVVEFIPLSLHHVPLSLRLTSPLSLFHPASKMAGQKKRQQMKNMQKREQKAIKAKIVMRRITHQISSVEEGRERTKQNVISIIILFLYHSYNIISVLLYGFQHNYNWSTYQYMCDDESQRCIQCHWSILFHHCQKH